MSQLVALVFDDPYKGEEARAALHRMGGEGLLQIDEIAILVKGVDGKMQTAQDADATAKGQHAGHLIGLVTAAITGTMPFILGGTLAGRLIGRLTDHGITNRFIKDVGGELQPGTSALIILGRSDPERRQKVVERLRTFNPKLLQSDLPPELEGELEEGLRSA
jgi:uncharacterized membrane protein